MAVWNLGHVNVLALFPLLTRADARERIDVRERAGSTENRLVRSARSVRPLDVARVRGIFKPRVVVLVRARVCLLYTSPSPRDQRGSRMPSSA